MTEEHKLFQVLVSFDVRATDADAAREYTDEWLGVTQGEFDSVDIREVVERD